MILKLHDGQIVIKQNQIPDRVNEIKVHYEFEFGTNQWNPVLEVMGKKYKGLHPIISIDVITDTIDFAVTLHSDSGFVMRTYKGTFICNNLISIGDEKHANVYKELERVYAELKKIKEIGEVI